ncbi:Bis(5'nucleosyl)-tetraphosphatase, ApaH [Mariprofundus aestuarium]|uniref:bis(5'-nucleosyl)-tetraphosphatase (symmetrical) n=1 Tax=Mariprofundus aestuarium TaxID=1921086 RepID=A0A2K8KXZ8_MARES|nr:symmetrical bis(5'-nucleosyl)-tetraphosphatase [Mariprofundus aestuarium]ATX79612.1 Bis(5'nucleosyl)-tetraphosphatase, ApaH [Mariprofundus aestuarium]
MATYAVGDIQGCYKQLRVLLKKVGFDPVKDVLWCAGDLVNRGPDSLKTLRFLKSLGDSAVCVLGNHDLHLLELVAGGGSYRRDTLDQVINAPDCAELIDWLRHRPLLHHDSELHWCMVHAGLHPDWTLKKAKKRARKIEVMLQGDEWQDFCRQLHHRQFPRREPKKGCPDRRLFSTAVLTRVRYCTSDGRFNWDTRSGESRDTRDRPWFAHKRIAWKRDCSVVYGHWAAMGLVKDQPHVLGLDSGCVWGEELTLARLKPRGKWAIVAQAE